MRKLIGALVVMVAMGGVAEAQEPLNTTAQPVITAEPGTLLILSDRPEDVMLVGDAGNGLTIRVHAYNEPERRPARRVLHQNRPGLRPLQGECW